MGRALTRRSALAVTAGLPVLVACGEDAPVADDPTTVPTTDAPTPDAPTPESPSSPAPTSASASPQAEPGVVATADVPVGGGVVVAERNLVVTQPTKGQFRGFSATCTHQGCTVGSVSDTINCPCHGSQYAITDGSVVGGPAPRALPEKPVEVEGGQVRLA